jgi:hypothetical protein
MTLFLNYHNLSPFLGLLVICLHPIVVFKRTKISSRDRQTSVGVEDRWLQELTGNVENDKP